MPIALRVMGIALAGAENRCACVFAGDPILNLEVPVRVFPGLLPKWRASKGKRVSTAPASPAWASDEVPAVPIGKAAFAAGISPARPWGAPPPLAFRS